MNKAEYVRNNNQWTPVGQCYLCDDYIEIRMVISGSGIVHPVCVNCIKAYEGYPTTEQRDWFMNAVIVSVAFIFIVGLITAVVALSRIAGGP